MRLAVLASHEGTTLQAVLAACASGAIAAEVGVVISNNSGSGALRKATAAGVAALHLSGKTHPDPDALDDAMLNALRQHEIAWVLLLGYMKKLGARTLAAHAGHILNTHPALLPKYGGRGYYGRKVHAAVLAAGEIESGATVHLVETDYDTGPILAQVRVAVRPDDSVESVEARVKAAEQKLVVRTIAELVTRSDVSNF